MNISGEAVKKEKRILLLRRIKSVCKWDTQDILKILVKNLKCSKARYHKAPECEWSFVCLRNFQKTT